MPLLRFRFVSIPLIAGLAITASCSGAPKDADAAARNAGGAPGAGGKGRVVMLAPTDVATAQPGAISEGVLITGTLRPLETVDVRARLEGDLTGVYVKEGQQVTVGQLLAQFEAVAEQSSAASAQAGEAAAQADLSQAEWSLKQTTDLYHAGAVSEADYRTAQQQVNAARARLAAATAAQHAASITARDTRVVAPISGVIDKKLVDVGEHMTRGGAMFTLVRSNTLELAAAVPERQSALISVGKPVSFTADGRSFQGRVARVSPTIDPASRSITVYVDIDNSDGALKGNSLATGTVISRTVADALLIPSSALRQTADSGNSYVYRVANNIVKQAPVTLGIVDNQGGRAQVLSGLTAGDEVIVGNVGTLSAGSKVQVIGGDRAKRAQ